MDGFTREERAGAATPAAKEAALARLLPGGPYPHARAALAAIEAPSVEAFCKRVVESDHFRVALARISMSYDGGQIIEGDSV